MSSSTIISTRHPDFIKNLGDWELWRDIWEGGDEFIRAHLKKWSSRESTDDFNKRKDITPVPGFAKAALTDIKNAVFHRMGDIVRRGGSESYTKAVAGFEGGIDRRGSGMNHFIGTQVLPEMLSMGRTGVYVDNISPSGPTLADAQNATPYLYTYRVEDILSWHCSLPEQISDFQAVLLRDWCVDHDTSQIGVSLPSGQFQRFRLVWIDDKGFVNYQFFDEDSNPIDSKGTPGGGPIKLKLKKIPFVMFDIGDSLFRDIANHQIALLNLVSSDVSYALKANFPFYTEQQDTRAMGSHIKNEVMEDGTATSGGQDAAQKEIEVGAVVGRIYDTSLDRPGFIHPSSEPLKASMALQSKLEDDIRKLVNLSVVSLANSRASGEARNFDNQGLEAGLAFIGMVLEGGERKIADHWSAYESSNRNKIVIKYPEQYSLKSQDQRLQEAEKLTGLMFSIPSTVAKKELSKDAVTSLMGGRVTSDRLDKIHKEIDDAEYATSDPDVIRLAKEEGLVSDITASIALGFDGKKEVPKANEDHAKRIARIQKAQEADTASARGIEDLSANKKAGQEEKTEATDTTLQDTTKKNVRGTGKNNE